MYSPIAIDMMKSKLYAHAHKAYQDVLLCNHTSSMSEQQTKELRELLSIFFGLPYSSIETVDEEGNSKSAELNQRMNSHEFAAVIDLDDDITLDDLDIEYIDVGKGDKVKKSVEGKVLDELELHKYCCRRMMLSNVHLISYI